MCQEYLPVLLVICILVPIDVYNAGTSKAPSTLRS